MSVIFTGAWPGAAGDPWPSDWTVARYTGLSSVYDQDGLGEGRCTNATASDTDTYGRTVLHLPGAGLQPSTARITMEFKQAESGAAPIMGAVFRFADVDNHYQLTVRKNGDLRAYRREAGTANELLVVNDPAVATTAEYIHIVAEIETDDATGDVYLRLRAWPESGTDPGTWTLEYTDPAASAFAAGGDHGIWHGNNQGGDGTPNANDTNYVRAFELSDLDAPSGTNYERTITDDIGIVEGDGGLSVEYSSTVQDALGITDSITAQVQHTRTITDTIGVSDTTETLVQARILVDLRADAVAPIVSSGIGISPEILAALESVRPELKQSTGKASTKGQADEIVIK